MRLVPNKYTLAIAVMLAPLVCLAAPDSSTPPPKATNTPNTPPVAPPVAYRITATDELDITVENEPDLSQHVMVLPDGTITYLSLGQIHAAGLTLRELNSKLVAGLSTQVIKPKVTVSLTHRAERTVSVLGVVRTPGRITLASTEWHVLDLIAAAGGLTVDKPDWATITLVRAGGAALVPLDLPRLMSGNATGDANPVVAPGDILLVTERDKSTRQMRVIGEVKTPGTLEVPDDGSITAALLTAGGPTDDAALSHATIRRGTEVINVDLRRLLYPDSKGEATVAPRLLPGDTLLVPRNERQCAILGSVRRPGILLMPEEGTLDTLQVLSLVGGGIDDADLKHVAVVRGGMNGIASSNSSTPATATSPTTTTATTTSATTTAASVPPTVVMVDLSTLVDTKHKNASNSPSIVQIEPGDVIFVPSKDKPKQVWNSHDALGLLPLLNFIRR